MMTATPRKACDTPIAFSRPFFDEREAEAAAATVRSGWVVGGPKLAEFERRFADICGTQHAVGVSSWTTGAFLVLHAWDIGPGDEVIVPSLSFIASVNVIRHVGATPVFADVDPATYNMDPNDAARKITPRTKALMPVDQLGMPCDMNAFNALARKHHLRVLDDAACAFGSRNKGRPVGSLADVSVFSLHARKIITTGEGGMVVTNDGSFAERLRRLRHQGMSLSDFARHNASPTMFESYPEIGYNFRLTDIQAAIGLVQLDKLENILDRRRAIACRYTEEMINHELLIPPREPEGMSSNWQSYQITLRPGSLPLRNSVMDRLYALGIPTRRGVMASHLEPPYRSINASLPNTEMLAAQTLQLPIYPALDPDQQDHVLASLKAAVSEA